MILEYLLIELFKNIVKTISETRITLKLTELRTYLKLFSEQGLF